MLGAVFAECVKKLEPGGRIAVNVANLGRRPVPLAVGRRRRHPPGRPRAAAARRGDLAEGARRRRARARGVRSRRRRTRCCATSPSASSSRARAGSTARCRPSERKEQNLPFAVDARARRVHGRHHRRVGDGARERAPRRPSRAVPDRAADAPHRPLHVQGRPRARSVHGFRHHGRRRRARRPALRRLRHRPRVRARRARCASRRNASARPSPLWSDLPLSVLPAKPSADDTENMFFQTRSVHEGKAAKEVAKNLLTAMRVPRSRRGPEAAGRPRAELPRRRRARRRLVLRRVGRVLQHTARAQAHRHAVEGAREGVDPLDRAAERAVGADHHRPTRARERGRRRVAAGHRARAGDRRRTSRCRTRRRWRGCSGTPVTGYAALEDGRS